MRSPLLALAFGRPLTETSPAQDGSAACGTIGQLFAQPNAPQLITVNATTALDCLQSVPVDTDANLQFIRHLNATIFQFEYSTSFLKNPPPGYQQPAVDLQDRLQHVLQNTVEGTHYANQYSFETDLFELSRSSHDSHFRIVSGTLTAFLFQGPFQLTSVSRDGQEMPELYAFTDLDSTIRGQASGWAASPLRTINGRDAVTYMKQFASNFSAGALEPHSDWNELMTNPTQLILDHHSQFTSQFVFTEAWFNVTFLNGTVRNQPATALALPNVAWTNITSGEDFYETFVKWPESPQGGDLAVEQEESDAASTSASSKRAQSLGAWPYPAYPSPFVIQEDFGKNDPQSETGSFVSGYMLKDLSLAVLSIPTFGMSDIDAQSFSAVVEQFLKKAKQANLERILIDVQGNGGGKVMLATEVFKHFFPTLYPYSRSQIRISENTNLLGKALSDFASDPNKLQELQAVDPQLARMFVTSPWVAQTDLDARTRTNFRSWDELASGEKINGEQFGKLTLADLNDTEMTSIATDCRDTSGFTIYGFGNRTKVTDQPYDAKNVAILTNGLCGSTCALFVELFTTLGGVKTVTAGGLPQFGQMQAVGETRGSEVKDAANIRAMFGAATRLELFDTKTLESLKDVDNVGIKYKEAVFNVQNQVRENSSLPLQFSYEPADCRIFYTHETFNNFTALWSYAAQAIFDKPSMCVKDSTGGKNRSKASTNGASSASGSPVTTSSSSPSAGSRASSISTSDAFVVRRRAAWLATILPAIAAMLI